MLTGPVTAEETRQFKEAIDRHFGELATHFDTTVTTAFQKLSCHTPATQPSLFPNHVTTASNTSLTPSPAPSPIFTPFSSPTSSMSPLPITNTLSPSSHLPNSLPANPPLSSQVATRSSCQVPASKSIAPTTHKKKTMPIPGVVVPNLKKKGKDAWQEVIDQWENSHASMGGRVLKDWPEEWFTGTMKEFTASKQKMRQVVAEEFYR
ncbi:hypothetical protein BDN67DRAFT_1017927 [Paxillus ammoniavirescens]|nr:hypothetical protein BDN67DRAFT_1017927 [Paxillus ammoniavirescens]